MQTLITHINNKDWESLINYNGLYLRYVPIHEIDLDICILAVNQNGLALQYVPDDIPLYNTICMHAVKQNGMALEYIYIKSLNDDDIYDIVFNAVNQNGLSIKYCISYIHDYNIFNILCNHAIMNNSNAFMHVYYKCNNHNKKLAITQDGMLLKYIMYPDIEFVKIAIKQNPYAVMYSTMYDMIEYAYEYGLPTIDKLTDIPDASLYLAYVKHDGMLLKYINEDNRTINIITNSIINAPHAIQYVKNPDIKLIKLAIEHDIKCIMYTDNVKIQQQTISNNPKAFKYISNQTINICIYAVKKDGMLLKYVNDNFKVRNVCTYAVMNNPLAIKYVPDRYIPKLINPLILDYSTMNITDNMIINAVKVNGLCINDNQSEDTCLQAILQNGMAIKYIKKQTILMCAIAIVKDKAAVNYITIDLSNIDTSHAYDDNPDNMYLASYMKRYKDICNEISTRVADDTFALLAYHKRNINCISFIVKERLKE